MRLLILGHKGMLGRTLVKYFSATSSTTVLTTSTRWGDTSFIDRIKQLEPEFIINAIGKIPQKNPELGDYVSINIELPEALEELGVPIIHPSTDCEFSGRLAIGSSYNKHDARDAEDAYGKSKAVISEKIENDFVNTKIIRTSIVGHENTTNFALLDWFLSQTGVVNGYTNHFWNGITTLEWSKRAEALIKDWNKMPTLNQFGTATHYSKYDVLSKIKEVYKKEDIILKPFETNTTVNKCLKSDIEVTELSEQLTELKKFFSD